VADILKVLLAAGVPIGIVAVIAIVWFFPDKAAVWGSWIARAIAFIFRRVDKKAVAMHLEGRFNGLSANLARKSHSERAQGIRVEWVSSGETATHFIQQDRVVLRLEPHRNRDRNFVHGSMLVIAATFVVRGKRLLSKTQRRAVDLHAARAMFDLASPSVANLFYEDVLGPEIDADTKLAELSQTLDRLDRAGLFFSVATQELIWLGRRVYVAPRDGSLVAEATRFFDFLARYAERAVGTTTTPLSFTGRYFKCAIVIVARSFKRQVGDITPWVDYARGLARAGAEAIYLIGDAGPDNRDFMDKIANSLCGSHLTNWARQFSQDYPSELVSPDKTISMVRSYMVSLRTTQPVRYERPAPVDPAIRPPGDEDAAAGPAASASATDDPHRVSGFRTHVCR
jgi:hypothetical protein